MTEKNNILIDVGIILALIAIGIAGYWYSPLLLPKTDLVVEPSAGCNLNVSACSAVLPDGKRLELSITPRPIPVVSPLSIELVASGLIVDKVEVDFAGISMNMGYNRPALAPAGSGRFVGSASLPVCVTGPMAWQVTLLVESGRQRISVPFRFEAAPH